MKLLQSTSSVADFCDRAQAAGPVALDMEFERERTYRAILQLVQLASADGELALVDPLAIEDLSPLWNMVADPAVEIVIHAGTQDMEIFYDHTQTVPHNLFDTQIASAMLGHGEQPGYADVVRRATNVRLKKGERTTHWDRRPLTPAQTEYALDDVRYLHEVRTKLRQELEQRGRLEWLREELAFYETTEQYVKDPRRLWMRVSRHRSLNLRQLGILRELAQWREEEAQGRNVPRNRVVADDVLIDLARRAPDQLSDLDALRRLHPKEKQRGGDAILAAVARGKACDDDDLPRLPKARDEDRDLELTIDLLALYVRFRSRSAKMAASYLATKKDLARLVYSHYQEPDQPADVRLLNGWRYELIGQELVRLLDGNLGFTVRGANGHLELLEPGDTVGQD